MSENRVGQAPISDDEREEINSFIPEARRFAEESHKKFDDPSFLEREYGHTLVIVSIGLRQRAVSGRSAEEQRAYLRTSAKDMIARFGPQIIKVMREELKLAMSDEDFGFATTPKNPDET